MNHQALLNKIIFPGSIYFNKFLISKISLYILLKDFVPFLLNFFYHSFILNLILRLTIDIENQGTSLITPNSLN